MRIALTLTPPTDLHFRWAAQVGVTDFVCRYPRHYGLDPFDGLALMRDRAASFGLTLSVVEGYLPIDQIVLGKSGRDEQIAELTRFVRHMGELGARILCYNFMHADWTRTDLRVPARGGALTNGFDVAKLDASRTLPADRRESSSDALWRNLEYMLERLVPAAEDAGVKLAMHPDDPPMPSLLGAAQIMHNAACYDRLFELNPSPANGMCFCQGTFAEMGTPDMPTMIRRFGSRIHYVHFRDVRGTMPKFVETFHDEGQTDMHAAMQAYREIGFTGPARPDHVPTLEGEDGDGDGSGYSMLGRLFAVGYMRGLIHSVYRRTSS